MLNDNATSVILNSHSSRQKEPARRQGRSVRLLALSLLSAAVFALAGCATMGSRTSGPRPEPVRVASIVRWSKNAVPTTVIIRRIRRSGTVYHLNAGEMVKLHHEGIATKVLDYMQATEIAAIARNRARMDIRQWHRYNDGYYYGGVGYGWEAPQFNFGDFDEGDGGDGGDEGH
ncbi:MAG TPA: hypothetical protein VFN79_11725 [Steroidobacteraceae bacterium]|nr:hypothetical protein [Steroidobacteraceae bacterium]